jgi:hypothetical protein
LVLVGDFPGRFVLSAYYKRPATRESRLVRSLFRIITEDSGSPRTGVIDVMDANYKRQKGETYGGSFCRDIKKGSPPAKICLNPPITRIITVDSACHFLFRVMDVTTR